MPKPHSVLSAQMMWSWCRVALLAVAISISNLNIAAAQSQATAGDLMGDARDEQQGVLPGVVVKATHQATGLARSVTTGPDGQFAFRALPVGSFIPSRHSWPVSSPIRFPTSSSRWAR